MKLSPARLAAFNILNRIEKEQSYSSILLASSGEGLDDRDRGLMYELTLGVLRSKLLLDRLIDQLSSNKTIDIEIRNALRIGLYQLRYLDRIPAHSAINESVELAVATRKRSAKGFINAILRRAEREDIQPTFENDLDELSVRTSMPLWLIERWQTQFGAERAASLARASNLQPRTSYRLTRLGIQAKFEPVDQFEEVVRSSSVEGAFIAGKSIVRLRQAASEGLIYFQDEGSQLVARALNLIPGESFLDVCAAPGSKTTLVAASLQSEERLIVAGDLYSGRLDLIRQSVELQGCGQISLVGHDAELPLPFKDESFDVVLVDAPCTGTGTLSHNPEIRYSLRPDDPLRLKAKQLNILRSASNAVKRGGRLIYSTCSLEREENEDVVEEFLGESGSFESTQPAIPAEMITLQGFGRTFPDIDGFDGFFIACLRRS